MTGSENCIFAQPWRSQDTACSCIVVALMYRQDIHWWWLYISAWHMPSSSKSWPLEGEATLFVERVVKDVKTMKAGRDEARSSGNCIDES